MLVVDFKSDPRLTVTEVPIARVIDCKYLSSWVGHHTKILRCNEHKPGRHAHECSGSGSQVCS